MVNKSRTTKTDGQGSEGNVGEGGNNTSQYIKRGVLKYFIHYKKEVWERRPVINLKQLHYMHLYHTIISKWKDRRMRYLFQDSDYLRKLEKMYIIVLLYRKARGNTFGSAGQKTYTI